MAGHLGAQEGAVPHPERGQDLPPDGLLERRARDPGQQQPEELEPGVGVGERRAGLRLQPPARQAARELAEGVVAELRVVPAVLRDVGETARVAQQTPGCDLRRPAVGQRELGHPVGDRGIQVEHRSAGVPSGRQRHDRGRDEGLGHRRQVEHRLGRDRRTAADVTDAEPPRHDLLVAHHRDGQACRVVRTEEGLDQRPQAVFHAVLEPPRTHIHVPTVRRAGSPSAGAEGSQLRGDVRAGGLLPLPPAVRRRNSCGRSSSRRRTSARPPAKVGVVEVAVLAADALDVGLRSAAGRTRARRGRRRTARPRRGRQRPTAWVAVSRTSRATSSTTSGARPRSASATVGEPRRCAPRCRAPRVVDRVVEPRGQPHQRPAGRPRRRAGRRGRSTSSRWARSW